MKKIFSIAPCGNDNAQFVGVDYIKFSISQIEDACDWMRKTDEIAQPLLANIDLLLIISKKYPVDANLLIEKDKVEEWKNTFNDWFERVSNKILPNSEMALKQ